MPIGKYFNGHGEQVMADMVAKHGEKKGKRIFYATANARNVKAMQRGGVVTGKKKDDEDADSIWNNASPVDEADAIWNSAAPEASPSRDMWTQAGEAGLDFVKGVGSGVASTGKGIYELSREAYPAVSRLMPGAPSEMPPPPEWLEKASEAPSSFAGKAGRFLEQAGEFMLPSGLISRGTKAIAGATAGMRGARALNAGGRAALEGTSAAGVRGVQTGGDPREMGEAALAGGGTSAAMSAVGAGVKAVTPSASRIYQSALKPRLGGQRGRKVEDIVETGLREGVPTNEAGLDKVGALVDDLNAQVEAGIKARANAGMTVDLNAVTARLKDLKERAKFMDDPDAALAAISRVEKNFLEGHTPTVPYQPIKLGAGDAGELVYGPRGPVQQVPTTTNIPVSEAQRIKQVTGTDLRKKYGELKPYEDEARKQLVRGLKEEIESVFPEVKALNASEGKAIELEEALAHMIKREGNHQLVSPFTAILAAAGLGAEGIRSRAGIPVALAMAGFRMAMENPTIKSMIAIAARRAAESGAPQAVSRGVQKYGPKAAAASYATGGIVIPDRPEPRPPAPRSQYDIPAMAHGGVIAPLPRRGHAIQQLSPRRSQC